MLVSFNRIISNSGFFLTSPSIEVTSINPGGFFVEKTTLIFRRFQWGGGGLVVSALDFHAGVPGSIPGRGRGEKKSGKLGRGKG